MTAETVKVNIFPIEVTIESSVGAEKVKAYKLTNIGMLMEVHSGSYSPHMQLQMKWELPALQQSDKEGATQRMLQTLGVVVKTYNQHKGNKVQYLIEVHFKNLDLTSKNAIENFLAKYEMMLIKKQTEEDSK